MSCGLLSNCKHRWECDFCFDFSDYQPIDRRIKSPAQIAKKEAMKSRKDPAKVKQGKRNKRNGKAAERTLEKLLTSIGLQVKRIPLSGALKATNLVGASTGNLEGDLQLVVDDKKYCIESKRRDGRAGWIDIVNRDGSFYYDDFCCVMTMKDFERHVLGLAFDSYSIPDDKNKWLHTFFEQDNSHIVAIYAKGSGWVIAVRADIMYELRDIL